MIRHTKVRAAAAIAVLGAMTLAGCGGGGSKSMLPIAANGATAAATARNTQGFLTVTLPNAVSPQSAKRQVATLKKTPLFIDTTTTNSAIVVAVTPQDPAEAAQYGNLLVCYNLYTNGVLAPNNPPNFVVTAAGNVASSVSVGIPAPPGTDGFQITQYAGQCSGAFGIPAVPAGVAGNGILTQTAIVYAYMVPGSTNNLNNQVAGCTQPVGAVTVGFTCPAVASIVVGTNLTSQVTVANIAFAALPIVSPVREQGAFILANGKIGIPIPLEALDAAGSIIPGAPASGAGIFPLGVVLSLAETGSGGSHTLLSVVDATNGWVAQQGATVTVHEFNALSDGTVPNPAGGLVPNDIFGFTLATGGHPYVIVLTYDGTDATLFTSVKVTATPAVASGIAAQSVTIAPQSAVYSSASAPGTGYVDNASPTSAVGMIQAAGNVYFTDGTKVKIDGPGTVSSPTTGANLTGLSYAQWPNPGAPVASFVYAVDQGAVGASSAVQVASGLYAFDPASLAATPVSAQAGSGNWVVFNAPVAVVQAPSIANKYYEFVVDKTGAIFRVDIANNGAVINTFQTAANVTPPIVTTGTALSPGTAKYLGTAVTAGGAILIADPGNNRIAQIDASQSPAVITTFASGAPFTGLSQVGTAVYATSTTGQIYYIAAAGGTPVSLGFTTAAAGGTKDGPIGQLATFTPAATPVLSPLNYLLQFQAGSFFDSVGPTAPALTAPYTLAPFPAANTKAFAVALNAGVGLKADTSAGSATTAGTVHADGGILVIPTTTITAGNTNLTSNSLLFTDSGKIRTLVK